ncbi:MAG TPA: ABC transporter permease [Solirubrobacterales bacterium]|nr:ABC transporter permease [Solirubrobacterales bacterium]
MNHGVAVTILASGVALAVPLLWAALGEVINETGGVLNIGIEGVMLVGAFVAALILHDTNSLLLAVLVAIPAGLFCGLILAFLYVKRGTDQIVTGLMFNLLATGVTTALYEKYLTSSERSVSLHNIKIPGLESIPVLGPALFQQTILFYIVIVVAGAVAYLLRRTWFGMYLAAVGERPLAGDTAGLDVRRLRTVGLLIGCALVSVGGASIIVTQGGNFQPSVTSGQGFIALAIVVLGRFKAPWIVLGAALFGVSTALQFQAQNISWMASVPAQAWLALPYLVTIVAVVLAKRAQYPAATAIPYRSPGTARQ